MPELSRRSSQGAKALPTREVVGEAYRRDSIRTLFPSRRLSGGHDLDKTARLVPEPRNPHDANAVAVVVDNVLVGYLARDEAAKYQRVLLDLNRAGLDATVLPCPSTWLRVRGDRLRPTRPAGDQHHLSGAARIVLDEWYRCRPVNAAPANHALLPVGAALQVQKEEDHQDVLRRYLNANGECWAYATLHVIEGGTPKVPKQVVELRIDGARVGQLTPASSAHYVATIDALRAVGKTTAGQVIVKGNTIKVEVVLFAARAHDLGDAWVREHTRAGVNGSPTARWQFNPAPGWPAPPADWVPDEAWRPPADWPPAPPGWRFGSSAPSRHVSHCLRLGSLPGVRTRATSPGREQRHSPGWPPGLN